MILYSAFGKDGSAQAPYNKGQTTTHEIGHWLNLKHIWGDENLCALDDGVNDTPLQEVATYDCPTFPVTDTCTTNFPGIMFMNYMDYSNDACMNIFTQGQKTRMVLTLNGFRSSLKTSQGCQPGSCDTLFYAPLPSYWINPTDAGSFVFNTEDNDGLTPHPNLMGMPTTWVTIFNIIAPGDTNFMQGATSWFDPAGQADNWIEFGPITIPAGGGKLSWQHLIGDNNWRDGYRVLITTTGMTINDFTTSGDTLFSVTDNDPQTDGDTIWTSQYAIINGGTFGGQQVYIAFNHNAYDMNVLYLDNFLVDNCPTVGIAKETFINNSVSIYPNPSSGVFFLRTDLKNANELNVSVLNILGGIVYSKEYKQAQNNIYKIDLSNNPKGIYFVRISNDKFSVTKKVVFY
ncbi:MAG: T9SS type A sorting domain-containing protein [Cytophagales bacterium]|nr:T9SS type A sorting domain-containing protein [Cytophagales bacterium]